MLRKDTAGQKYKIHLNLYGKLYLIIKIAFTDFFDSYIYIVIHLKERS